MSTAGTPPPGSVASGQGPGDSARRGVRLDPDDLPREAWPAPGAPTRWRRRILAVAAAILALVAVIGLLGGFEPRADVVVWAEPGEVVTNGGYEFALTAVTVSRGAPDSLWTVDIHGTCRNVDAPTEIPAVDQVWLVDLDRLDAIVRAGTLMIASTDTIVLPLGGRTRPCTFSLYAAPTWEPPAEVQVAIWEQRYADVSFTGLNDREWIDGNGGWRMVLPVTRIDEE